MKEFINKIAKVAARKIDRSFSVAGYKEKDSPVNCMTGKRT